MIIEHKSNLLKIFSDDCLLKIGKKEAENAIMVLH